MPTEKKGWKGRWEREDERTEMREQVDRLGRVEERGEESVEGEESSPSWTKQ